MRLQKLGTAARAIASASKHNTKRRKSSGFLPAQRPFGNRLRTPGWRTPRASRELQQEQPP